MNFLSRTDLNLIKLLGVNQFIKTKSKVVRA